jgi:TnpA family transposase
LKDRTTPAHVVLDRLAARSPSDRVAKAQTIHGRIVNTVYMLRYPSPIAHARGKREFDRPSSVTK